MVQILTDHGAGCNFNVFVDDGAANGATFADSHIPQQHGFTDVAAGAYVAAKSQYGSLDLAALNEAATGDQGVGDLDLAVVGIDEGGGGQGRGPTPSPCREGAFSPSIELPAQF
jgi:hypothetical protein